MATEFSICLYEDYSFLKVLVIRDAFFFFSVSNAFLTIRYQVMLFSWVINGLCPTNKFFKKKTKIFSTPKKKMKTRETCQGIQYFKKINPLFNVCNNISGL
jgi:hypothetical protein